jgi:predicted small lipoprotein YifL
MSRYYKVLGCNAIRSKLFIVAFALFSAACFTGCGQTGPLYLPDEKPGTQENNEQT